LEAVGNVYDAKLSYTKWLEKKVETISFMAWHEFVRFIMRQNKAHGEVQANYTEAIFMLCKSVQMLLVS